MNRYLVLICLFFTGFVWSQEILVIDAETGFPVPNCVIYAENNPKTVDTDANGKADISIFKENEILYFNNSSYVEVEYLKRQLSAINFEIQLYKNTESLDEIILSVTRQKESRSRVAEQVEVNQLSEIRKLAPQTSADLLANIPGIKVQKSQFGGGSPVLRGLEANRVLLVVDGVRMNNAIYRSGHLQSSITVSPSILERAEVSFGPSSVIYGSDALGGVIHYYTKTPKTNQIEKINVDFLSRYSTSNNEFTNQGSAELSFKKWASLTSISHSKFGDLMMGKNRNHGFDDWGKVFEYSDNTSTFYNPNSVINSNPNLQKNTGYNQTDFLQKFYVDLKNDADLTVNMQYSTSSNISRFDKLTEYSNDKLKFAEWYYGPQKRFLLSSQLSISPRKNLLNTGTITVAYQNIKESRIQRKISGSEKLFRDENVNVFSLNGDFTIPMAVKWNRNLSYGFELTHNEVDSDSYGKNILISGNQINGFNDNFVVQSRYPDGGSSYTSSAIYTSYRQDISSRSTLNTGIRFTNTRLKAKWIDETFVTLPENDISVKNAAVTATIGYIYKPTNNFQFNSVLSSGFRSPNIDDIGKIREKSGKVSVPNIDLKPEYIYNAEIGLLKYLNNRKFRLGLNVYYSILDNYISREKFSLNGSPTILYDGEITETYANVNHKTAYIVGSTFSLKGNFSDYWGTNASVTYTKGKTNDTKLPLSSIPPIFGNISLNYSKNRFETALNFKFNAAKKLPDYNLIEGIDNIEQTPYNEITNSYEGTPSWNILNIYSKYKVTQNIDLQLNIDNIFDQHYKEFASGISASGRNFSLSVFVN